MLLSDFGVKHIHTTLQYCCFIYLFTYNFRQSGLDVCSV